MSIPGSVNPLFLGAAGQATGEGGYLIERSLRFNSADSAYLSRTPASAGNRKTWTWAGWVKKTKLIASSDYILFDAQSAGGGTTHHTLHFGTGDKIRFRMYTGSSAYELRTTAVYRDLSAWMQIVAVFDSSNATSNDRAILYANGVRINTFDVETYPSLNLDGYISDTGVHSISKFGYTSSGYGDFYLADIHFIDGQALDPTSFGEFDANGIWQPIEYTGTYGTNGFHLDFADNASTTTIGYDAAGSNDWTANNLSVTAGSGNDSLVDVPTNGAQTDTGAGGEVRGNYATLNPLNNPGGSTLSNGNLDCVTASSGNGRVVGTISVSSGKWYWEMLATNVATDLTLGISAASETTATINPASATTYLYNSFNGNKYNNGSNSAYGATYTTNDVIGVALDLDAGTLVFYKNGVSQGTAYSSLSGTFVPAFADGGTGTSSFTANFGQRSFAYTAPSGFKALNTANLPAPLVTKPSEYMDVVTYTGTGAARSITGLGFSPDFVWVKSRDEANTHNLYDIVRGTGKELVSNTTAAEASYGNSLTSFDSTGFGLGEASWMNGSSKAYVAWTWDAGSSTVTNTQGSISSQVRANASAGFSVITYTGTGSSATIGHGLGAAPQFFLIKRRNATSSWIAWHTSIGNSDILRLESTNATQTISGFWQNTRPTSSLIYLDADGTVNGSGDTYVAYCFAPVAGYGAFGSYTGNGSADGSFTYLGFLPKLILIKRTDTTSNWTMLDTLREGYNVDNDPLYPNLSDAEGTTDLLDINSNGFKLRTTDASVNASGGTYIFAAWASNPFQYSRAR